jgi:hypothetical protein
MPAIVQHYLAGLLKADYAGGLCGGTHFFRYAAPLLA